MRETGLFGDEVANASQVPISGSMTMTNNVTATDIVGISAFVKAAGTTVAGAKLNQFTHSGANRLTYTGASTIVFTVWVSASLSAALANQIVRIILAKNAGIIAASGITAKLEAGGAGNEKVLSLVFAVSLATGDYIELWVANDTAIQDIIVQDLNMVIQ